MNAYKALKTAVDSGEVKLIDCSLTSPFGASYSTDELRNISVNAIIGGNRHAVPLNALRRANGTVLEQPNMPYNVSVEFLKSYDRGSTNIGSVPVGDRQYALARIAPALPGIKANVEASRKKAYDRLSEMEKVGKSDMPGLLDEMMRANGGNLVGLGFSESPLERLSRTPLFSTDLYTQLPGVIEALLERPR